jgi:hypothetical protein
MGKMFLNYTYQIRGSISMIYKEFKQLSSKIPPNNPIKNGLNTVIDAFPKKTYKCHEINGKKCSISLITNDMQIRTTRR